MINYSSTYNYALPPAAKLTKVEGGKKTVGGYSHLVKLLPFLEYMTLYNTLVASKSNVDPENESSDANVKAMNTAIKEFICPDGPRGQGYKPPAGKSDVAITNYKAMAASTCDSLKMVADPSLKPPYGKASLHPDGAVFPADTNLPMAALTDGTSHTIMTMETMDDTASRWAVGKEAMLDGLPQKSSPTGDTPKAPYPFLRRPALTPLSATTRPLRRPACGPSWPMISAPTAPTPASMKTPVSPKPRPPTGHRRCIRRS